MGKDKTEPLQNKHKQSLRKVLKGFCFILPYFLPYIYFAGGSVKAPQDRTFLDMK